MSEKQPIIGSEHQPVVTAVTIQPPVPEFGSVQGKLVCSLEGHRDWSSGLCECTNDPTNCLMTLFCYPCVMCQMSSRMGEMFCMPCFVPAAGIPMRARLRTVGGIQGTICNDCVMVSCCPHLVTCQMKRELDEMRLYSD